MIRKNLFFLVAYFTFSFAFAQEGINQEEINQNAETNQNSEQNLRQNLDKQLQTTRGSKNFKFYFYPVQNANASNLAEILGNISGNIVQQTQSSLKKKSVKQLSIVADKETNSLIIYANSAQYAIIKNAIEDLDVIRPQVFVEALIVEIGVK